MLNLLIVSVALPLLGAAGILLMSFLLSRFKIRRQRLWIIVSVSVLAVVAAIAFVVGARASGRGIALSSLSPSLLAESAVEMRWDVTLWPLGLALLVSAGALMLGAGGRGHQPLRLVAVLLLLLGTGLAAVWSANPLTTLISWAFFDVAFVLAQFAADGGRESVLRILVLGTAADVLLWAGVLVGGAGIGSVPWELVPAGGRGMTIWMLAALLRLGLYPLHLTVPRRAASDSPLVAMHFVSPVLGWALLLRLALVSDRTLPAGSWMVIPAVLTFVAGGILAWTASSARKSRPWIGMAANGAVLLGALLSSLWRDGDGSTASHVVPIMTLGTASWIMATTMVFLGGGFDLREALEGRFLWREASSVLGMLSMLGVPATAGFAVQSALMRGLVKAGYWPWTVGFLIGQALLVAAVVRWLQAPRLAERAGRSVAAEVAYGAGLTGVVGLWIVGGTVPSLFFVGIESSPTASLRSLLVVPTLRGWLLWGGSLIVGAGLAWGDAAVRAKVSLWLDALHDIVRLDWVYNLVIGALEQGFAVVRAVDEVLGGRAALLWSCILLLVLILLGGW